MTMRSAFFILATSLVLVASLASAFVTPAGRTISTRRISLWAGEAEEVGDDPFQNYKIGDPLQGLAINDAEVGEGEMAAVGNVITVTYTGRLLATGKVFDQGDGFSLKLGAGKAIQGWEQGLLGVRAGGKRILRIPPKLAYGEKGARDVIPPNADLEFDIRVKGIASGPVAETLSLINISSNRLIGLAVLLVISILLPQLGIGEKGFI